MGYRFVLKKRMLKLSTIVGIWTMDHPKILFVFLFIAGCVVYCTLVMHTKRFLSLMKFAWSLCPHRECGIQLIFNGVYRVLKMG